MAATSRLRYMLCISAFSLGLVAYHTFSVEHSPHPITKVEKPQGFLMKARSVKCLTGVVTIPATGRLGNYIMQYASAFAVAAKFNMTPLVPTNMLNTLSQVFAHLSVRSLNEFINSNCPPWMTEESVVNSRFPDTKRVIQWPKIARKAGRPIVLRNKSREIDFIVPMLSEIKTELAVRKELIDDAQEKLHQVKQKIGVENIAFIGVHVRRTDYPMYLREKYQINDVNIDYYKRTTILMRKRLHPKFAAFIILSDDPIWCKEKLMPEIPNSFYLGDGDIFHPANDFALLTACNHSIISYGTFAAWSSLLAGGMTFVYRLPNGLENTAMIMSKYIPYWELM